VANEYLPRFLDRLNARFGVPAGNPELAYCPLPAGVELRRVCCFKFGRIVSRARLLTQTVQLAFFVPAQGDARGVHCDSLTGWRRVTKFQPNWCLCPSTV
jgi:hypothetical protein